MKRKTDTTDQAELAHRMRDMEKKMDHLLFMLAECRRLHCCDRCGEAMDEIEHC